MPGFLIFTAVLFFYGITLTLASFKPSRFTSITTHAVNIFASDRKRFPLAACAIVAGLWNLFAPDFGAMYSPTLIGAIVPSSILIFDGLVIFPEMVVILDISKRTKKKFMVRMTGMRRIAGPVTIVSAVLHIIFFRNIIF